MKRLICFIKGHLFIRYRLHDSRGFYTDVCQRCGKNENGYEKTITEDDRLEYWLAHWEGVVETLKNNSLPEAKEYVAFAKERVAEVLSIMKSKTHD